jgi:alanyl-tRNA synthetase
MPAGEPGGPDSEVFYDFGTEHDAKFGPQCHPNCDCGRFLEIGNSVFMQYIKKDPSTSSGQAVFELLPKQNVDFGGGLERIMMAAAYTPDIIAANHAPIVAYLEQASDKKYADDMRSFRIIADHMKAAVFLIGDGVRPSNSDQGYYVRRLIRRSVRYADRLGIAEAGFAQIVRPVADMYKEQYPELQEKIAEIETIIGSEEEKFRRTLARGMKELERFIGQGDLSAQDAFQLVTTYGFPLELILEGEGDQADRYRRI